MTRPEVSVVVVSYRCADHLGTCLDALAQHHDVAHEVIVVDNASGDGTAEVAGGRPGVTLVERDANGGFARAANEGMARATGRAVLVLNPDAVVPPGTLRACLDALWAEPDVAVLGPRVVDAQGSVDARCHRRFPTAWSALCFMTGLDRVLPWRSAQGYLMRYLPDDQPADVDAVSGAFMLMRVDALHEVGGFDQQFFMYAEDIDLCMRFRAAGWRVGYRPVATVVHVGGGSGMAGQRTPAADAAAFRTMAPLIRKHRPGVRGAALALLAFLAGEAILLASRARRLAYSYPP